MEVDRQLSGDPRQPVYADDVEIEGCSGAEASQNHPPFAFLQITYRIEALTVVIGDGAAEG